MFAKQHRKHEQRKKFGIVILIFLCISLGSGGFIFCPASEDDAGSKGEAANTEGQELAFEMQKKETAAADKMQKIQRGLLAGTLTQEEAAKEIESAKKYLEEHFEDFRGNEEFLELLYYSAFLQNFWADSGNKDVIRQNELISIGIEMHDYLVDFYSNGLEAEEGADDYAKRMKSVSNSEISELIDLLKII